MPSTNGTISEVIVGTGVLYVAQIANDGNASGDYVAFPADNGSGAWAAMASGWVDVGYSEHGCTLEGKLAQACMSILLIALGGSTFTSCDCVNYSSDYASLIPPSTDDFDEKSLLLKVDGPAGADRHVEIPRAINVGAFSMAHQKAPQKVVIATEFKVLLPKAVSQHTDLFRIVDNKNDTDVFDIN